MRCKWLHLGRLRYAALIVYGNLLNKLAVHDDSLWRRCAFKIFRYFWELITPSDVYKISSSTQYSFAHKLTEHIVKSNRTGYSANVVVVGKEDKQILKEVKLPDLKISIFNDVCVSCEADLIVNKRERLVVNDYCANKTEDLGYDDSLTYYQVGVIAILKKIRPSRKLTAGIRIDGRYSFNYYHNVYENLIRLLAIEKVDDFIPQNIPFILDSKVLEVPSFKKIFEILSANIQREFVTIDKDESVEVETLYSISAVNYLVPIHLDKTKGSIQDYIFDKEYVQLMRERLLSHKSLRVFPKRIFITRKNATHRKINEDEVFALLEPIGFERLAPEELTFEEQLSLFNNAEWIIGCSGAAFTNLMFCSENCHIICLDRFGYSRPVFTAPVCFCGADMRLFYSEQSSSESKVHSDFVINVDKFEQFVKEFIIPTL